MYNDMTGVLDDLCAYNRALSANEILELVQLPPTALADTWGVAAGQTLTVAAPGVLGMTATLTETQ